MKRVALILLIVSLPGPARAGVVEWLPPAGAPKGAVTTVVSLAPSITEMIYAVGAGALVRGVTRYDDWPPEVRGVRRVGGYLDVDIEAVLAIRPGAVLCEPNAGIKNVVTRLAGAGIPVGVVRTSGVTSIFAAIEEVGAAVGRADEGKKTAAALRERLAALDRRIAGRSPVPVLLFYNVQPPMAAGAGSFADQALGIAGGRNLAGDSPVMYPVYDIEKVAALDPVVIIDQSESTMGATGLSGAPSPFWKKWRDLRAVKAGRVVTIPGGYLFRPGPRIVESIEMIARVLHPEAFTP